MPKGREIAVLCLAISLVGGRALAEQKPVHIPRIQIEEMFANIKTHTSWDINGNLRWGYYFTADDRTSFEQAANLLTHLGYKVVEIRPLETESGSMTQVWQLHVERVEHHTAESLSARDDELYRFAESHGLASYDGMDVGPVK